MTEVLVTGGNGFVGHHLVAALRARGDRVRVLALPGEDTGWLEERGIAVHRGDIRDLSTLVAPMHGVEGVFHLAAMMDVWRPLADYREVNVAGTANVCRAALLAGVRRLVHMSSSSVYGVSRSGPTAEDVPLAPLSDPYPLTKAEGEQLVQRFAAEKGLPAVIVRPDQIFGPGDELHFAQLADRLRAGRGVLVGSGRNTIPLVYVSDAVQGLLLAFDRGLPTGRAYNITTDRPLTQHGFLRGIAEEVGGHPPRIRVPFALLDLAGRLAEAVATFTRSQRRPPVTRLGVSFLGTDARFAIERARRELAYEPRVDLRDGIRLTAEWYREQRGLEPPASRPASESTASVRNEEDGIHDGTPGRDRHRSELGYRRGHGPRARPPRGESRADRAPSG
jgi:nucleoside-diphosphate-sugar epimerase